MRVISSAYSIYQAFGNHFESFVIFTGIQDRFSFMYIDVASPSIFGLIASINSSNFQFFTLSNNSLNLRSFGRTQFIGEIDQPSTW